ncbi:hypothetical protein TU94_09745 [Streptomyces cyaneogriseus subsp. noncyanogenus]|uniref:Uncharacterized protein n=1 Tax=Streptomyces cyaneogriseus subsp. noncyanogenus TaxID=477245 RepID=A0A0C5G0T5_9ACTN|nr:hypothetical protein [Streptomyces cyaneogriseus]AJP01754.1 hypothetical protein TU94_09745 [Streptomyces cyaneogriseus subsp. noncyanogenus]
MIRIVTGARIARLERDARVARAYARQTSGAADEAFGRHLLELYAAVDRAERAEATATEVGVLLARAVEELSAAQQELLLKDIEIRRLRAELEGESLEGRSLTVLLHYGEPHTIYASREDAYADTATHGVDPGAVWVPAGERPAAESEWRCAAFIYDAACNGFRRAWMPAGKPVGEVA